MVRPVIINKKQYTYKEHILHNCKDYIMVTTTQDSGEVVYIIFFINGFEYEHVTQKVGYNEAIADFNDIVKRQ